MRSATGDTDGDTDGDTAGDTDGDTDAVDDAGISGRSFGSRAVAIAA